MGMSEQPIIVQVELDKIAKLIEEKLDVLKNELKSKVPEDGKGIVLPAQEDHHRRIIESMKYGGVLREQWETPLLPPTKPMASLMDHVRRGRELEARRAPVGSTVYIPVIKDVDADILETVGATLTPKASLYDIISATIKEAAVTTEIGYHALEQLSEELLASIESAFQKAIIRAVDKEILDALANNTAVPEIDKSSATVRFSADWIPEAMGTVAAQGRDSQPSEFVLVIDPMQYIDLYKNIVSSQPLVYGMPNVVRDGLVAEFMGVRILVSSYVPSPASGKKSAFLIHKNAVVLAPQRNILFETEKDTQKRLIKLTGTITFAVAVADPKAVCEIITVA